MQEKKTALITGATGGLGAQLCREFARHGYGLVVTARDPEKLRRLAGWLRELHGVPVTVLVADLNQPNAAQLLYRKVRQAGVQVDVLVNNAGFGLGGLFVHNRPRVQDAMVRVNMLTPMRLCRLFLPGMLRRGYGGVLNIASTGGFVAGPYNAVYCAGKAYLLSLTEALAHELRETPVKVAAVCPGAMATGFANRAGMESTLLFNVGVMPPAEVARRAYRAWECGKMVAVPGAWSRATLLAARLMPREWATRLSALAQKQGMV